MMRLSVAVGLLLAAAFAVQAQQAMPRMTSAEPTSGKTGDVIVVSGENLTKTSVAKVFLTDGTNDTPVDIVEQNDSSIKFKIPKVKPGRLALAVLIAGKPQIIEMPVKVTVEE